MGLCFDREVYRSMVFQSFSELTFGIDVRPRITSYLVTTGVIEVTITIQREWNGFLGSHGSPVSCQTDTTRNPPAGTVGFAVAPEACSV